MTPQPIPCTDGKHGCAAVKYFRGRCNDCQHDWETKNLPPPPADPYAGLSWVEECMKKVGVLQ